MCAGELFVSDDGGGDGSVDFLGVDAVEFACALEREVVAFFVGQTQIDDAGNAVELVVCDEEFGFGFVEEEFFATLVLAQQFSGDCDFAFGAEQGVGRDVVVEGQIARDVEGGVVFTFLGGGAARFAQEEAA